MNRVLQFFGYEQCFTHYTKRILNIRQAKIHGETIVAKPVLMMALIDAIDSNVFTNNQFAINDWLEGPDNMRGFDPASEDDMDDNGMSRYMENNDEEGWD